MSEQQLDQVTDRAASKRRATNAANSPAGAHTSHQDPAQLRRETSEALKRASRWIDGISWLYRLGALAYAVATFFAIVALARTDVPVGAGVLVVVLTTTLTVLLLVGSLHVLFEPYVWNLILAILATTVAVIHLFGPNPLGIALPASATLAVLLWCALIPILRARALIGAHKDLYILHHASSQTRRALRGRTADERHERLVNAMRRAARRTWGVSAGAAVVVALASGLGTNLVLAKARPQVFATVLGEFRAAWNGGELDRVGRFYDPRVREQESLWLSGRTRSLGWAGALPVLERGQTREDDAADEDGGNDQVTYVDFEVEQVAMSTQWMMSTQWVMNGKGWHLAKIELPPPPLEPAVERLVAAWGDSDPAAISSLFATDHRQEMLASIQTAAAGRSWSRFPAVVGTEIGEQKEGSAVVVLRLDNGSVTTRWHLAIEGDWILHGLKLPKR